jgi:hypothetical protein
MVRQRLDAGDRIRRGLGLTRAAQLHWVAAPLRAREASRAIGRAAQFLPPRGHLIECRRTLQILNDQRF